MQVQNSFYISADCSQCGWICVYGCQHDLEGLKQTVPAAAPLCVYADTRIFAKAPRRLNASGVSDLLENTFVWRTGRLQACSRESITVSPWQTWRKKALKTVKGCLRDIGEGDEEACEKLMYALILSGLAMQMVGNSRPASGAEHHLSHLWEMEVVCGHLDALHGEKVSVGMMLVLKKYKEIEEKIRKGQCHVKEFADTDEELLEETFGKKAFWKGF